MKNTLSLVISVILLSIFTSCGGSDKVYKIGVSQCNSDDWRAKCNEEILREVIFHQDVTVEIRSAEDNNEKQIADVKYFADNGFDIIIVAPREADAITPIIEDVYNRGIPVIIFDRDINGDSYTSRIRTDNREIGRMAGRYALSILDRTPTAIEIYGLEGSSPTNGRRDGFAEVFRRAGGTLLGGGYGNWNYEDAAHVADSLLNIYPTVDLIYAHNDRMAIAASQVAKAKGLNNIKIIGIDAAPEIGIQAVADGVIDATFLYPTEGYLLVKEAIKIIKGEPFNREITLPLSSPVNLSNADILLRQNESLKQETTKVKDLKHSLDAYWHAHSAQTSLFYATIVILMLVCLTLFLLLRAYWQRKRHQAVLLRKNQLLQQNSIEQKRLNEKLSEAMQAKLTFYTNVSHDLRTPLTLIAEPVAQLAAAPNLNPQQTIFARLADKNVKILGRLINQILDFRKYENDKLSLNLVEINIDAAIREWITSFDAVVRSRDIKLTYKPDPQACISLAIDPEKMERIFFNLIGNAIKFTPDNGSITISTALEGDTLCVSIADTGIGISADDLSNIFERFFQSNAIHAEGSGIGLTLVKSFVELHGGTIKAQSTPGEGSVFTFTVPIKHIEGADAITPEVLITQADVQGELAKISAADIPAPVDASSDDTKPCLLVVDDNQDIRLLITELLSNTYDVHTAVDGRDGLTKAMRLIPDVIICDIMMPVMDGLEFCKRIKEEISTSHIPVLILTACAIDSKRIEGYNCGADSYLIKPFTAELLEARCRNLIENRKRIRDIYAGTDPTIVTTSAPRPTTTAEAVGQVDLDNDFYKRFIEIFNREMSNQDLNIENIAAQMGLGHSQFYRKIKALTNYTPVELVRRLRLKHARRLLLSTDKTISEIAYEVGFSSPAYFTKCYRSAFGETPTELRDNLAGKPE